MPSLTFVVVGVAVCLLSMEIRIGGHPVNVELTENESENQIYEDQINDAGPVNDQPAAVEEVDNDSAEDSKPDINIDTESEERNVNEEDSGEEEEETENGENVQAVESGKNKRVKRESCEAPSVYDEDMKRYDGVFGGYPQDLGVKRVKRSLWY